MANPSVAACEYRNALGRPGEGVHEWRIFESIGSHGTANGVANPPGLAGADVVGTVLVAGAAAGLYTLYKRSSGDRPGFMSTFLIVLIILALLGVGLHWMFCVNTPVNTILGLDVEPDESPGRYDDRS